MKRAGGGESRNLLKCFLGLVLVCALASCFPATLSLKISVLVFYTGRSNVLSPQLSPNSKLKSQTL